MFTGTILATSKVIDSKFVDDCLEIEFALPPNWNIREGESINTNGVCLTVNKLQKNSYICVLMPETLANTTFGKVIPKLVNLERALKVNDRLDGHIVQGHVDCVGTILKVEPQKNSSVYTVRFNREFSNLVVKKGSVSVDGISLTIVDFGKDWLRVSLVEYSLEHTTIGDKNINDLVNIEFDVLGKYLSKLAFKQ